MVTLPDGMRRLLDRGLSTDGPIVFLTGAGISAESGIPTFRGEEGYWTIGAREYRPEQLATRAAFEAMPKEVWSWYLYRRGVCHRAEPNQAHEALVELERGFHDRLVIITQNVDGLHLRAGSLPHLTYQIHGNLDFLRHDDSNQRSPQPMPGIVPTEWERGRLPEGEVWDALRHPETGRLGRPHVLWFDECYDEELFRFESSLEAAASASLLIVVGTSGATNLPLQVAAVALQRKVPVVALNRDPNTAFAQVAEHPSGWFELGSSSELVPAVADYMMHSGIDRIA